MPVQQQQSSFAKDMGGAVSAANAEFKDAPPVTPNPQSLPAGIKDGIAKISSMYCKQYIDDKQGLKGKVFFRASAIVVSPTHHTDGSKIQGGVTQQIIPMCEVPAKGQRKAKTFAQNFNEFKSLFQLLGIMPPQYTPQTDPTGTLTEAYYFAAMKALTDSSRPPTYVKFSTRGWTPDPTPQKPKPTEMVFESWHGLAQWNGQQQAGSGVADSTPPTAAPHPMAPPPSGPTPVAAAPPAQALVEEIEHPMHPSEPPTESDPADEVAYLVEVAMADPNGTTEEGGAACRRLEELAWAVGITKEQTGNAMDWAEVGDMALGTVKPTEPAPAAAAPIATPQTAQATVVSGGKFYFAKRTKDGQKLCDKNGKAFPPQEVVVATVDAAAKTCTLKSKRDNSDIVDIRTKKPVAVKFEWLEPAPVA